jgi:small GTP-binding protein
MEEVSPYYRIKCLFGGEPGTGKSSIVYLTLNDEHDPDSEPTIGLAFAINKVELEEYPLINNSNLPRFYHKMKTEINPNGENCQLIKTQIWDAAGQVRYRGILPAYLRDIDIAFLVFDMSKRDTWDALLNWKKEIDKHTKSKDFPMLVLVGSKSDLKPFQVTMKEIDERAKEWNAEKYIVSCVEQNSSSMIKRMMYNSFLKFHEKILNMQNEGKELPEHVTPTKYEKEMPFLKLGYSEDGEKSKFCCFQ